jgi:hypothetical protein
MPFSIILNDGNIPFGTQTISVNGATYYIESSTATKESNVVSVPNEVGAPRGQVIIGGQINGSLTLQYTTTASVPPKTGDIFVMPAGLAASGSAVSCSFTSISTPRSNNSYWTMDVGFVELINPTQFD